MFIICFSSILLKHFNIKYNMKKGLHKVYFILFFIGTLQVSAQKIDYKEQAAKEGSNFYEIVNKTRKELSLKSKNSKKISDRLERKASKIFERWVWIWKDRVNADGSFPKNYNKDLYISNYTSESKSVAATSTVAWEQIGPNTIVNKNGNLDYPGPGRVDVVAVDPTDSWVMYVGTTSGGLWKTTDNGVTWAPKTDNLAGLGVTDILIDSNNTDIIYMATGDRDSSYISSIGLFKSTDAGETWLPTALSFSLSDNEYIRDIAFPPNSTTTIFALTNSEIKKSTDSGATWTNTVVDYNGFSYTAKFQSLVFDPDDATKVVVSDFFGGLYYSTDSGDNFAIHAAFPGGNDQKILRITATPADNNHFYGINQEGVFQKYRFNFNNTLADLVSETTVNGFNSQQGYIQCIAVSPTNANNLMVGGVQGWKSTNNGGSFSSVLNAYDNPVPANQIHVHADHHFLMFLDDNTIINGNDAGLRMGSFSPTSDADFPDISSGLIITQSYNIAVTQGLNGDDYMMANQDNDGFSKVLKDGVQQWVAAIAGDGTGTAIDYNNPNIRYLGGTNGSLDRTDDGYESGYDSKTPILPSKAASTSEGKDGAAFISPLTMHPTSSVTLYAGHEDVKKTTDKGDTWSALNSGLVKTSFIEVVTNGASTHIYAIGEDGNYNKIAKTSNDETNWTPITPPTGTTINSFAAIPETNTVYASVSGYSDGNKVYKSLNNGTTWTNISAGLPNTIMKKVIVDTSRSNETLYVGTELGVYWKNNSMASWAKLGTGLPNVIVTDLKINYTNDNLYIGTFGRGLWKYDTKKVFYDVEATQLASDVTNWEGNSLPTSTTEVLVRNNTTMNVDIDLNTKSLELETSGNLILQGKNLVVENDLIVAGSKTLSGQTIDGVQSSIIIKGNYSGSDTGVVIESPTYINNKWYIIGIPLITDTSFNVLSMVSDYSIRTKTDLNPHKYAFGTYYDTNATGNKWDYYTAVDNTTLLKQGVGYSISKSNDDYLDVYGKPFVEDKSVVVLADHWNAISNPYIAYYPLNKNSNNNFIKDNLTKLDPIYPAVYLWDEVQEKYIAHTDLSTAVAQNSSPYTGFFIKTKTGETSVDFKKANKVKLNGSVAKQSNTTPSIKLYIQKENVKVSTDIQYLKTATSGFDAGYDIGNFNSSFDVYSKLVDNSLEANFTLQSLSTDNYETIIPVGIISNKDEEVIFSLEKQNLPKGISIYLEDKITNKFIRLDEETANYKVTFKTNVATTGRFFIHVTSTALSLDSEILSKINVFKISKTELRFVGLENGISNIVIFNALGKSVLSGEMKHTDMYNMSLPKLAKGIYFIKLETAKGNFNKKIILD